jgi:hypothetical protein
MSAANSEIYPLIPLSLAPSNEAFVTAARVSHSDIFPNYEMGDTELDGPVRDYVGGNPPPKSPLGPLITGLHITYESLIAVPIKRRTEAEWQILTATQLQIYLGSCIYNAQQNLIQDEMISSREATERLRQHVDSRDREITEEYEWLALAYGAYVGDSTDAQDFEPRRNRLVEVNRHLERLKFEWLSSQAILQNLE